MEPDNHFSLQKLEVFVKVAELGGVRKAAEELRVSQPVVSAHLRSLQQRLGARLFSQDGRGIRLTEAGAEVHHWATEVLRGRVELDRSLRSLSAGSSGNAVIGASMSVGNSLLPPTLIRFRVAHPDAYLSLIISAVEIALEAVHTGRADFCVVGTDAVLDARAFDAQLIGRPPFALIASGANHNIPDRITPEEIARLPFVMPPSGMAIRRSQDAALASLGVNQRHAAMEFGSAESLKQAVAANVGVALLWKTSVLGELANGTLRELHIDGPPLLDRLYLVKRQRKNLTAMQTRLVDAIISDIAVILTDLG